MDKLVHHFFLPIDVLQQLLDYLRAKRTNLVFFFCQSHPVAFIVQFTQKVKYLFFSYNLFLILNRYDMAILATDSHVTFGFEISLKNET